MVWREGAIIQHLIYPETLYTQGSRNITHTVSTVTMSEDNWHKCTKCALGCKKPTSHAHREIPMENWPGDPVIHNLLLHYYQLTKTYQT